MNRVESEGCFFNDGKRRVDFVIVTDNILPESLETFLKNIMSKGLDSEITSGLMIPKSFILIHLRPNTFQQNSRLYEVGLEEKREYIKTRIRLFGKYSDTPISEIPGKRRGELSSADRILIIHKILENCGLSQLISEGVIETVYPLHDGRCGKFPSETYRNDRQLLLQYWANLSVWYKETPLDLVEQYFGTEIAFYFAWLEYFNLMLIPMAILGVLVTISNVIVLKHLYIFEIEKICEDKNTSLCPTCETPGLCVFKELSQFCMSSRKSYLFDNHLTVSFAICMSFWATIFLNCWKKRSNELRLKWDVKFEDTGGIREKYLERAIKKKFNTLTREEESFIPIRERIYCRALSISICFLMILLVLVTILGIILLKMAINTKVSSWEYTKPHAKLITLFVGCGTQVVFIKLFGKLFYGKLCIKLTTLENPRTQSDFDKSVLYKKYVLAFTNNYAALFYMAFIKGRFYEYPRNYGTTILTSFKKDTCQPLNCVVDLGIQLAFIMFFKQMAGNLIVLVWPSIVRIIKTILRRKVINKTQGPQYEEEYLLQPVGQYNLMVEFCEMVIEYSHVTFFVAAFPLAPLLTLINNILEQRLDAYKFVVRYRRPIPKRVAGIGSWDGVLLGVTHLSTVTNAFVIAFTSDFVAKELYRYTHNHDMTEYVNSTLSEFATVDYPGYANIDPPNICVYRALRYPYWHEKKYEKTRRYWVDMTWRCISVFIFEHVVLLLNGILSRAIPTIPKTVKEQINVDNKLAREAVMNISEEDKLEQERLGLRNRQRNLVRIGPVTGFL